MSHTGLINHGGHCCGVTHLYLGGYGTPTATARAVPKWDWKNPENTGNAVIGYRSAPGIAGFRADTVYTAGIMCKHDFPAQSAGQRVDAQLARYVKDYRRAGIIEVAITDMQRPGWDEFLTARGFVEVGSSRNSNTERTIHMYMLFYKGFKELADVIKAALPLTKEVEL